MTRNFKGWLITENRCFLHAKVRSVLGGLIVGHGAWQLQLEVGKRTLRGK